jgi:predicted peptidase
MKRLKLLTVLLSLFFGAKVNLTFAQKSVFSFEKYTNGEGDTLNYRQLYPDYDTLRKYPLVIFLHGSGERGNDNESQLKWGVMNFASDQNMIKYPAIVIAPQCPEKMNWANFSNKKNSREKLLQPAPSKPMELLIVLIRQLIKKLPVDTNRIYITGLSMGGL